MARAGLGDGWKCAFANDFDPMKCKVYEANWEREHLHPGDIGALTTADLPGRADLVWASFPCQDLSLAGNYAGIGTEDDSRRTRSGTFWAFWRLMLGLRDQGRAPPLIVLENVYGILTANGGRDFAAICRCLSLGGYVFGALLVDAVHFLPQSRPRIFVVAVHRQLAVPKRLIGGLPDPAWHPAAMADAISRLDDDDLVNWRWWRLPQPSGKPILLDRIVDDEPEGVAWHSEQQTAALLAMMSDQNSRKLALMRASGVRRVGTIYKRTRPNDFGVRRQRAELRDDGVAGCLRTPGGGSSRQTVVVVNGDTVRTRLLSPREAARLMGLPESYKLPARYNDAYHIAGDGLAVPAVRHLARHLLEPLVAANLAPVAIAAE